MPLLSCIVSIRRLSTAISNLITFASSRMEQQCWLTWVTRRLLPMAYAHSYLFAIRERPATRRQSNIQADRELIRAPMCTRWVAHSILHLLRTNLPVSLHAIPLCSKGRMTCFRFSNSLPTIHLKMRQTRSGFSAWESRNQRSLPHAIPVTLHNLAGFQPPSSTN
jgi:hypothetical protein